LKKRASSALGGGFGRRNSGSEGLPGRRAARGGTKKGSSKKYCPKKGDSTEGKKESENWKKG